MRNAYLTALYDLAKENKDIVALISDNGAIVYDEFREAFPDQYLNMGISEANMIGVSAGMASCGKIPFAYTIANFLVYRAFEQIRNDCCLQRQNVKLVGIGVGFIYSVLGPTHHTTEDIALMRSLPNMTVFSPCDPLESKKVTYAAAQINGPVYIRLATGGTPSIYEEDYDFQVGKGVVLREGDEVTMISTGSIVYECLKAVDELREQGISARLINMHTLKPLDKDIVLKAAEETKAIITVEEQNIAGGLGGAVAEIIAEDVTFPVKFKRMGLRDVFPKGYGTYHDLLDINRLSKRHIVECVQKMMQGVYGQVA